MHVIEGSLEGDAIFSDRTWVYGSKHSGLTPKALRRRMTAMRAHEAVYGSLVVPQGTTKREAAELAKVWTARAQSCALAGRAALKCIPEYWRLDGVTNEYFRDADRAWAYARVYDAYAKS